jgi:hypothetical protein
MADNITDLASDMEALIYNPASLQRAVIQTFSDVSNGTLVIFDPTNPLVGLIESGAAMVAAYASKDQANLRQMYAKLSQTQTDLYGHMSDTDYLNMFASPASATFTMLFSTTELFAAMIADDELGYSYVEIPRDSNFTVADTTFSLQYPIQIRQLSHGGIQIAYDLSEASPLQTLNSNAITWEYVNDTDGTQYLSFNINVIQVSATSVTMNLNASVLAQTQIAISDNYYYTRAWYMGSSGTWEEIATTMSPLVYDAATPTVVLQLNGNTLTALVPQIYTTPQTTNGAALLNGTIRLDVYQTQGEINLVLSNYSYSNFTNNWVWLDNTVDTTYSAPISNLNPAVYCNATVSGGAAALTFAQQRQNVINNTDGPIVQPITSVQAAADLQVNNYQIVNKIDNITDLIFLAVRSLPTPVNSDLITAAGSCNGAVTFTMDALASYSYVIDNDLSMTITPDALYKDVNGVMTLVSDSEINQLANLSIDQAALTISATKYRYCPFHYVLDNTTSEFAVRAYYLDGPTINSMSYEAHNDTTGLQVTTTAYSILKSTAGYTLTVSVTSNATYKTLSDSDCQAVLMYTPEGEKQPAYLMGTLSGLNSSGERIFNFNLASNFNVDSTNAITLTEFSMFTSAVIDTGALLSQSFTILYCTTAAMPTTWVSGPIDALLPTFLVPTGIMGITEESIAVQFGEALEQLWTSARTTASAQQYQTYSANVPATYSMDVYERDSSGAIFWVDSSGQLLFEIEHHKGDPVLDSQGNQVYAHMAGDPVIDASTGQPILASDRTLQRTIDIMLVEGVYRFGNDTAAQNYRTQIVTSLVSWITNDLADIELTLIEPAELYYYPQQSLGSISVMSNGTDTNIEAAQSLVVTLSVPLSVYNNTDLRDELDNNTITTISQQLQNATISNTSILSALQASYGEDVVDVTMTGLGGTSGLTLFTVIDSTAQCSIKKKLVASSDNSLIVEEDVTINYLVHDTTAS